MTYTHINAPHIARPTPLIRVLTRAAAHELLNHQDTINNRDVFRAITGHELLTPAERDGDLQDDFSTYTVVNATLDEMAEAGELTLTSGTARKKVWARGTLSAAA